MALKAYHIGLLKDYDHPERVIVQVRQSIDDLSCELWRYLGPHMNTKKQIHEQRIKILEAINAQLGTTFTKIRID